MDVHVLYVLEDKTSTKKILSAWLHVRGILMWTRASIFIRISRIIRISGLPGSINPKLQIRITRIETR